MTLHTDSRFKVILDKDASSPNPQRAIWTKQHFCVSEDHRKAKPPTEQRAGEIILEHELKGNRGHFSVLDFANVSFNCYGFPHSTMTQIRTHASSGLKVLSQSGRYTGKRFIQVATGERDIEDVLFFSPVGTYQDRKGNRYEYTEELRQNDINRANWACVVFKHKVENGAPYELAREGFPYEFRQDFGFAGTLRSVFHMLFYRSKKDAEEWCQVLAHLTMNELDSYCPELAGWFREKYFIKGIPGI